MEGIVGSGGTGEGVCCGGSIEVSWGSGEGVCLGGGMSAKGVGKRQKSAVALMKMHVGTVGGDKGRTGAKEVVANKYSIEGRC